MGVTGQEINSNIMDCADDKINCIENYLVEPTTQVKKPKKKKMHYIVHDRSTPTKRKLGVRQARRSENMNCLLALLEGPDDLTDQDFFDITEPSMSAFSELFNAQEKMKIWNDFVNSSEEEQQKVLGMTISCQHNEQDKWEVEAMEKEGFTILDKRQVHPSYSAAECFKQIDSSLRTFLNKRHMPMGTLCQLEEEVVSFFAEWPSSIYIAKLESSFQRLMMHALCQYLSLSSKSFDDDHGKRQTQVENKHDVFQLPEVSLSEYLSERH